MQPMKHCSRCNFKTRDIGTMGKHVRAKHPSAMKRKLRKIIRVLYDGKEIKEPREEAEREHRMLGKGEGCYCPQCGYRINPCRWRR